MEATGFRTHEIINLGDLLLLKFEKKKSVVYFIVQVISKYNLTEYQVSYLRKNNVLRFYGPNVKEQTSVVLEDVIVHLPNQMTQRAYLLFILDVLSS